MLLSDQMRLDHQPCGVRPRETTITTNNNNNKAIPYLLAWPSPPRRQMGFAQGKVDMFRDFLA